MKKIFLCLPVIFLALACNNDDDLNRDNPYLINPLVDLQLDLSLPEYNQLNFPGNSVIINSQGIRGIVVYNIDNNQYTAFDLTDPNHAPNDCSRMEIEGIEATCPCSSDDNQYDIVTGQNTTNPDSYPMQQYRARRNGDVLRVYN